MYGPNEDRKAMDRLARDMRAVGMLNDAMKKPAPPVAIGPRGYEVDECGRPVDLELRDAARQIGGA